MRLSTAKDRVLKAIVTNNLCYQGLKIDRITIDAALVELAQEKYIEIIEVSISGYGLIRTYAPVCVLPKGIHFINSGYSFRNKSMWEYIETLPKRWTFILAIIGLIAANIWQWANYKAYKLSKEGKLTQEQREADLQVESDSSNTKKNDLIFFYP